MTRDNNSNERLVYLVNEINKEINETLIMITVLRLSVSLAIPEMQDGNNFGVDVQQQLLKILAMIEANAIRFNSLLSSFFMERGKLVSNIYKYPFIINFKNALTLFDFQHFVLCKSICFDFKTHFCCLLQFFVNHFELIKNPRSNHFSSFF